MLGRVSNLPTVWSNCLTGWGLGGGGRWDKLLGVSLFTSLLYIGGMFLNDAFDAEFDRNNRRTRPIPSGAISRQEVWRWGFAWIGVGLAGMMFEGKAALELALMLTALILLYNALHKLLAISPILMGGCRILLYLTAAATGEKGVTGEAIWKGLALGSYVVGLSCLARKETSRRVVQLWPASLLAAPVLVAFLVDNGSAWKGATFFSVVLALWSYRSLSASLGRAGTNVGYTVSHLLAGIVLVDLLAVANPSLPGLLLFALCFVSALLLQRSIPAT